MEFVFLCVNIVKDKRFRVIKLMRVYRDYVRMLMGDENRDN